jgi:hypothetical protein
VWPSLAFSLLILFSPTSFSGVETIGLFGTYLGLAATLGAVFLACEIYARQQTHSAQQGLKTSDSLASIKSSLDGLDTAIKVQLSIRELEAESEEVEPEPDEEAAAELGEDVWIGDQLGRAFNPKDVPLSVIGNLVWGLRLADRERGEPSRDGRWTIGNLQGAWRPLSSSRDGRGNTPWYLTFSNTLGERRILRIYRGGRSRSAPSVRDITDEIAL